jgi:DNA-binding NtrC family response regulator
MNHVKKSKVNKVAFDNQSVLIVDDNPQYASLLERILSQALGYKDVVTVTSTDAARELIHKENERFDILFVDYNFPEGECGGSLLKYLKENGMLENRTAFLITSEPTLENQREALDAGAMGVVAKPFDRTMIRAQIEKAERALEVEEKESF